MVAPRGIASRSRVETIEGRKVHVVERRPPLPQKLDLLLSSMTGVRKYPVTIGQTLRSCEQLRHHRFVTFREGRHVGLDGVVRELRLQICQYCEAVCVRDTSLDVAIGGERLVTRTAPRRRDLILGWYSGKRRASREYC